MGSKAHDLARRWHAGEPVRIPGRLDAPACREALVLGAPGAGPGTPEQCLAAQRLDAAGARRVRTALPLATAAEFAGVLRGAGIETDALAFVPDADALAAVWQAGGGRPATVPNVRAVLRTARGAPTHGDWPPAPHPEYWWLARRTVARVAVDGDEGGWVRVAAVRHAGHELARYQWYGCDAIACPVVEAARTATIRSTFVCDARDPVGEAFERAARARPAHVELTLHDDGTRTGNEARGREPYRSPWRVWWRDARGVEHEPAPHPAPLESPGSLKEAWSEAPEPEPVQLWARAAQNLAAPQLEAVVLAEAAFARSWQGWPQRAGFLLCDGAGTGKGRTLATLFGRRWLGGETRATRGLWISVSPDLLWDARRDAVAVGLDAALVQPLEHPDELPAEGVVFTSYARLRKDAVRDALTGWLRTDPAAVGRTATPLIAWDESHALRNTQSGQNTSQQGRGALVLSRAVPGACVIYAGATAIEDARSLGYLERMQVWDREARRRHDAEGLVKSLKRTGLAGLEMIARELAREGRLLVRTLALEGVEHDRLEVPLDEDQQRCQTRWSAAWGIIQAHWEQATRETSRAPASDRHVSELDMLRMRFFRYLLSAYKARRLIEAIEADVAAGHAPVVQLTHTHESLLASHREMSPAHPWKPPAPEQLLREEVLIALERCFPVWQYEPDPDAPGSTRVVRDRGGEPVPSMAATAARARALAALRAAGAAPVPLLDQLVMHFGERLAEVSGRGLRYGPDARVQTRDDKARTRETVQFCRGERDVLVFTLAGAYGRSYHASREQSDRRRRVHYVAEPAGAARVVVQSLGRTHRAHQWSAPRIRVVTTDLPAEARFASVVNRRLAELGAATGGDRTVLDDAHVRTGRDEAPPLDLYGGSARRTMQQISRWCRVRKDSHRPYVERLEHWNTWLGCEVNHNTSALKLWNRLVQLDPSQQHEVADAFLEAYAHVWDLDRRAGRLDRGIEDVRISPHQWRDEWYEPGLPDRTVAYVRGTADPAWRWRVLGRLRHATRHLYESRYEHGIPSRGMQSWHRLPGDGPHERWLAIDRYGLRITRGYDHAARTITSNDQRTRCFDDHLQGTWTERLQIGRTGRLLAEWHRCAKHARPRRLVHTGALHHAVLALVMDPDEYVDRVIGN